MVNGKDQVENGKSGRGRIIAEVIKFIKLSTHDLFLEKEVPSKAT